ncbi:hypothetical protein D3C75_923670 [compost metagenome]
MAEERAPLQFVPLEIRIRFPGEQECAVTLSQLGEIDHRVVRSLLVHVNGGFRSNKRHINRPREQRCHRFVSAWNGLQLYLEPFILEEIL